MTPRDVDALGCPACRGALRFRGTLAADQHVDAGNLDCAGCGRRWPVADGLPRLVDEGAVRACDRFMRFLYDRLGPVHDLVARVLLPVVDGASEETIRDGYMRRLALGSLANGSARPLRVLDVGVGTGGNLPFFARDLPPAVDVELWGIDLSPGMLAQCRRRLAPATGRPMRLVIADAHALPFPDASFDRVLNTGGIGGCGDIRRALSEMARVARPGTPIVVVDEQLDPDRLHGLHHRALFRAATFYEWDPRCPRADLPEEATNVLAEQLSRFYYCLSFRMPARDPRSSP